MSGTQHNVIRLQDKVAEYAHDLLAIHTVREYEYVIGEWEGYIDRVIDAEKKAVEEHRRVLDQVLSEMQRQQQESAMFAMLALTLLTGPALSWIGGAIQYKLYPYLQAQKRWKTTMVFMKAREGRGTAYRMSISESEHSKVAAKVFGDAAANLAQQVGVGLMLGPMTAGSNITGRAKGKSYDELTSLAQIKPNAPVHDLHQSLRTKMLAALRDEKERTVKTISDLALEVRRNPNFARNAVDHLLKTYSQIRGEHSGPIMQGVADRFVEKLVDDQRRKWAKEWLYYGNLPPQTSVDEMSRKIEREIWAIWIVDQEFKLYADQKGSFAGEVDGTFETYYVEGREGLSFHPLIVDRLIELGVVVPQNMRQIAELNERNFGKAQKELPTVGVTGNLDNGQELAEINHWALNRQPEMLSGHFDSIRRDIGSVVNVHKIVKR